MIQSHMKQSCGPVHSGHIHILPRATIKKDNLHFSKVLEDGLIGKYLVITQKSHY